MRKAVVNPGSSSWWLLSLAPVLYFEKVRVSSADLESIHTQDGRSAYHMVVARTLSVLQRETGQDIIVPDHTLPARGKDRNILKEARELAAAMVAAADAWTPRKPSGVRPVELKRSLTTAYREWIRYNRNKVALLPGSDPLRDDLLGSQIPRSIAVLSTIVGTRATGIPDLVSSDPALRTVFENIVRNALLLISIADRGEERAFDVLAPEFIPTIELVERMRLLGAVPATSDMEVPFDVLVRLHNVRVASAARNATNLIHKPDSIVFQALRERERFASLRKRLSELDETVRSLQSPEVRWLKEVISLAKATHEEVERLDKLGTAFMWLSGAYFLSELLAGVDPSVGRAIRIALVNPITSKAVRDTLKNLHLARKGFGPGATAALAVIRDYVAVARLGDARLSSGKSGGYEFWV